MFLKYPMATKYRIVKKLSYGKFFLIFKVTVLLKVEET